MESSAADTSHSAIAGNNDSETSANKPKPAHSASTARGRAAQRAEQRQSERKNRGQVIELPHEGKVAVASVPTPRSTHTSPRHAQKKPVSKKEMQVKYEKAVIKQENLSEKLRQKIDQLFEVKRITDKVLRKK